MEEGQERQPLLGPEDRQDGFTDRRQSIVSFHAHDSGNPLEWSKRYRWFSVGLLCMFAAVVYAMIAPTHHRGELTFEQDLHLYRNCASGR